KPRARGHVHFESERSPPHGAGAAAGRAHLRGQEFFRSCRRDVIQERLELAIVIGKPCVGASAEEALNYVAGYAAFNDISARDVIRAENQSGIHLMGKSFPGFAPMGPCLLTADEIPDPQNLGLKLSVNGETRQDSNLSYMIFKIREMIAYWSQMGLNPGDVLTTGTPRGVAAGRKAGETPWWLKPGDVVEAEVQKVGRLRNRIVLE